MPVAPPITVLVQRGFTSPMAKYVKYWGETLVGRVRVRDYPSVLGAGFEAKPRYARNLRQRLRTLARDARRERLLRFPRTDGGRVYIFSDIERLSPLDRQRAGALRDEIAADPRTLRALNHPARSLCRYELLRLLHDRGQNAFDIYRLSERVEPRRFPVFIRGEDDHDGPTSELIESPGALRQALADMEQRGEMREGKLIVEYCDVRGADGVFRKYGAFRVGDRIVPRHVFLSREWMLKEQTMDHDFEAEEVAAIENAYLDENPHAAELLEIFELARIDYGRIDYGVKDGRIQVWEINTNPTILTRHHREDTRAPIHRRFAAAYRSALDALGDAGG